MKIFDSRVQEVKYQVLRELAKQTWKGNDAFTAFNEIASKIIIKGQPPMSCCIYKDRAIIADRMRIGLGRCLNGKSTVQVVTIACDECPKSGYTVTNLCRGCLAKSCKEHCPKDAIFFDENNKSHIDKSKCVECGKCAASCRYDAITNLRRPCEQACSANAITTGEDGAAHIIQDNCIVCGECLWKCPFGALQDRSFVVDVVNELIRAEKEKTNVYAIIAPAIVTQYPGATLKQIVTGIKALGFAGVVEVARGADVAAKEDALEIKEKGFVTSSCCPAFVEYVRVFFPSLVDNISTAISPMGYTAKEIKEKDSHAKVVFIGPCIAKKYEKTQSQVADYIDYVITFEELQAMFDAKDIELSTLEETKIQDASMFGRGFALPGGVTVAVGKAIEEMGLDIDFKPLVCDGIADCKVALTKAKYGKLDANFIEGMACKGGCVAGNGSLLNKGEARRCVDEYCDDASFTTVIHE